MDQHDRIRTGYAELGALLDRVNDSVRATLVAGDDHGHADQLLERAWIEMVLGDLHGRPTVLGRVWERFMTGDIEQAARLVFRCRASGRQR
jgi:hypothetical protein